MKATWGNKYTSQFTAPEDVQLAMRVWLRTFPYTDRELLHLALEKLSMKLEWPPTIEQMMTEVRAIQTERTLMQRALPAPMIVKQTREVARQSLNKMKAILRGSS